MAKEISRIEIKLKDCCLDCEHFSIDGCSGVFSIVPCEGEERIIACGKMSVCWKYRESNASSKKSAWINAKERLPENAGQVLVCRRNKELDFTSVAIDSYDRYGRWDELSRDYNTEIWSVTYWQPLPPPPEK